MKNKTYICDEEEQDYMEMFCCESETDQDLLQEITIDIYSDDKTTSFAIQSRAKALEIARDLVEAALRMEK